MANKTLDNVIFIKTSAEIIMAMFKDDRREALNFILIIYKSSPDEEYKEHLKSVFWHIVDNYVEKE